MLSRITRNSDRPRASDRTMVDTQIPASLALFHDSIGVVTTGRLTSQEWQTNQSKTSPAHRGDTLTEKWAGSRYKIFSPSGRGEAFFLTSLFIELIDPAAGGHRICHSPLPVFEAYT